MATTQNTYTGDGSTTDYTLTFPYLAVADVRVSLDDVGTTAFSLINATTLRFNSAPANGVAIRIYRVTDDSNNKIVFTSGSSIKADDLNDAVNRNLYIAQETTSNLANVTAGGVADNSLTTSKYADNSVTTPKIGPLAVTTAKLADLSVTTAKLADSSVTDAKLANFVQDGTGAVGRSLHAKLKDSVSVKDFGAVGNGVANDKAAIQAAIDSLGSSGGSIYFPHGDYLIDSQLLIDKDRVSLVGNGIGTKIICNNTTSGAIKVTKTSGYLQFFTILDLQIQMAAGASVTAGAALELDEVSRCNIQNVYIDDGFIGVLLKGVQQCNIDNLQVLYEDDNFGAGGTGRRFLKFLPGTKTNLHGGDIFITNFNGRCGSNFDCEYGVEVTAVDGLWINNSHIGNCEVAHMLIHHNTGVKTVGILCDSVWFDQTTTGTYGVVISGTGESQAGFYRFNNCTFLASLQPDSAHAISCSGVAGNIAINDCEISGWGGDGIFANNTTGGNRIDNCRITSCGLTNGDGIQIDVNTGWSITNNKIEGGQHQHHIRVVQPSSYVYVNNNIVDTPAVQGSITDFTGTNISLRDNIGFNPAGYLGSPVPSNPWTYTNPYGYPVELFVNGGSSGQAGTITGVQYKTKVLNFPQNSYELRLAPGESVTISFSGNLYADVFGL